MAVTLGPSSSPQQKPGLAPVWPTLALLGALWLWVWALLYSEWEINPQYSYGWGVPILGLYLFARRWPPAAPMPPANRWWPAGVALLLLLCLPVYVVYEANPDWRLVSWVAAFLGTAVTFLVLWGVGGAAWVRHFAVPVLFLLTAVPWPSFFEARLVHALLSVVTSVTTEALNWLGIAAFRQGNVIKLASGLSVGVNEACSGVRSFQSSFMLALFVGELFRLRLGGRLGLVVAGAGWALLLNMARTGWLAWLTARKGVETQQGWHDPAGYLLFGLLVAGIWLMGKWAARAGAATVENPRVSDAALPEPSWVPRWIALPLCGWLGLTWVLKEAWYRTHEAGRTPSLAWSVRWPNNAPGFRLRAVDEQIRTLLRSNQSEAALWERGDGTQWVMFFNRWEASRISSLMARVHRPEICLPATGFELVERHPVTVLGAGPLELPFRTYVFTGQGRTWYVFFCVMEERAPNGADRWPEAEPNRFQRLRQAWLGQRNLGQQALEVVLTGYRSLAEARLALAAELPRLIQLHDKS